MSSAAQTMPVLHNPEAETALAGCALLDASCTALAEPGDFHDRRLATIWAAIKELHKRGQPVDFVTLTNYLDSKGKLNDAGGAAMLAGLVNATPSVLNAAAYADIVRDLARRRKVVALAENLARAAITESDGLDISEIIDELARASSTNGKHAGFVSLGVVRSYFGAVEWEWPGYIPRGHVSLIAGETGLGKSWLLAYLIAAHLGLQPWPDGTENKNPGSKVLLLETEEMRGPYAERLAALGVPDDAVILPGDDPTYLPSLVKDATSIEALACEAGVTLVVVDSLSGGHALDENSADMRGILQILVRMAGSLGIPILVAHHARKRNAFEDARMTLDRVRGSSTIVQFCRSVLGLYKPDVDSGAVRVESLKNSFASPPEPFGFTIADDAIRFGDAPEIPRQETAVDRAVEFLRVELRREPRKFSELLHKAEAQGISKNSLYRARDVLKVGIIDGKWTLPYSP